MSDANVSSGEAGTSYSSNDIQQYISSKKILTNFLQRNSQKTNVIWTPKINGRSRYAFSIPKDAYLISKKHSDSSELYYLSEIIDNGYTLHQDKSQTLDIRFIKR